VSCRVRERRRSPYAGIACFFFCALLFPAQPLFAFGGKTAELATVAGKIASADPGSGRLVMSEMPEGISYFTLDEKQTLVFRGIEMLGLDELKQGMAVELQYLKPVEGRPALATWIEVAGRE